MIMCLRISYVNLRIGLHIHPIIYYLWMFEVKYWNSFFVSSYMFLLVFLHILKKWMMSLMCLFCMQIFLKYTLYTYVCEFNFMRRRSVVPFVQPCWPLRWDCWKVHVLDDLNGVFCSSKKKMVHNQTKLNWNKWFINQTKTTYIQNRFFL
jgi:hypothetical protein